MAMKYELTSDLMTGNSLIDAEHKQLFDAINDLMDACAQGDEEKLQVQSKYPGYAAHKQFHDGYKRQLSQTTQALIAEGPTVKALGDLNRIVGVLVSHIRIEDKKLARHVKGA